MENKYIEKITEGRLRRIGRTSAMNWLEFGKDITRINKEGKEDVVGEFVIIIETPWRIFDSKLNEVVITSDDMAFPLSNQDRTKDFNWDVKGGNLFDEKAENIILKLETEEVRVSSVEISDFFELIITFSNGWELQTFTCDTDIYHELWRFFQPSTKQPHLVGLINRTVVMDWE